MKRLLYFEYIHPINDYFRTIKLNEIIFEWVLPFAITAPIYKYILPDLEGAHIGTVCGYIINFLAILIGFSVTCLTILSSASSESIDKLKKKESHRSLHNKKISLYHLIVINFIFLLVMEFFNLFFNLGFFLFSSKISNIGFLPEFFSVSIFITCHVIFLNIRNVTNFYFVFSRVPEE
jgi:hypothetical protein